MQITGGGNGIGKAIAHRFAGEGCNVAVADLDFVAAQKTAKELNEMNVTARAYHVKFFFSIPRKKQFHLIIFR